MAQKKPSPSALQSVPMQPGYQPHVVVKFRDDVKIPYEDNVAPRLEEIGAGPWKVLEEKYPGIRMRRLFNALVPGEIQRLVDLASQRDRSYKPVNFLSYFAVDTPARVDPKVIARELSEWPSVETAYFDPPARIRSSIPQTTRASGHKAIWTPRLTASMPNLHDGHRR